MTPAVPTVVLMCGLPASGKTTVAARLHAQLGGALIRSCDVFARLGIDLPAWVRRTRGFTEDAGAYERLRDGAYVEMARRLAAHLTGGETLVIVDAVHAERKKRRAMLDVCAVHRATPVLVWCRCDDFAETARRIAARRGRDGEPEHEASDLSVYRHIVGLWDDPLSDDVPFDVGVYDTCAGRFAWIRRGRTTTPAVERIADVLGPRVDGTA